MQLYPGEKRSGQRDKPQAKEEACWNIHKDGNKTGVPGARGGEVG